MQVYEKEFSISLTTRTGLVIKQSFEPRRIHSFPLLFLITAELVCERYAQLAETRVMVGYILRLEADARRRYAVRNRWSRPPATPRRDAA